MIERSASCACGAIELTARGEPVRISLCHCGACKRRTGSAFSLNAWWPQAQVEVRGPFATNTRLSEDGHWAREHFCPTCAVRTFYQLELRPGMTGVPAGLFMAADFPPPTVELYGELAMRWMTLAIAPPPARM